jgi:aminoglycoside 2'-N-acetyltransferase I
VPTVHRLTTAELSEADTAAILRLLDDAFAGEFGAEDWEHARGGVHAIVVEKETVVAHAAVVPRAIEVDGKPYATGYVEAVASTSARQSEGMASLAMDAIATTLHTEYELGALSTGRHGFYARLGWERWQGPTFVRRAGAMIRSEEDDDGLMVLRFGPSARIDLHAPISCPARSGDDW